MMVDFCISIMTDDILDNVERIARHNYEHCRAGGRHKARSAAAEFMINLLREKYPRWEKNRIFNMGEIIVSHSKTFHAWMHQHAMKILLDPNVVALTRKQQNVLMQWNQRMTFNCNDTESDTSSTASSSEDECSPFREEYYDTDD